MTERAYGMNYHKEYFTESSEAFFGTNDFFPINREQRKRHDPQMEAQVGSVWSLQGE
ncbi:hypothetical protein Poly51_09040 [Rubripirellula tenax]|uniref:Uncharacterized protein n=2 Tax=Rubripirellula tenax TaxID=2528015 RepID=A0A5C6FIJ9_9BACT|nr:hypothetical protein Poly51_09040 [Rubripirellula tenax]